MNVFLVEECGSMYGEMVPVAICSTRELAEGRAAKITATGAPIAGETPGPCFEISEWEVDGDL